jgi:hypothetical protein
VDHALVAVVLASAAGVGALLVDLGADRAGVGDAGGEQLDGADRVVVARDDVVDHVGIAVGVGDADHRDLELAGLVDGDVLLGRVDHEHHAGELGHALDAAQRLQELLAIAADLDLLALGQRQHRAVLLHLLEHLQALEAALDGLEVGERAAQPALGDVELAGAGGLLDDHILGLLLGADEQHQLAARGGLDDGVEGGLEQLDRVGQVDDVDAVAGAEDVLLHLRVPPAGVVAEVDAGLEELAHRDRGRRRGVLHRFHGRVPFVPLGLRRVVGPETPRRARKRTSATVGIEERAI